MKRTVDSMFVYVTLWKVRLLVRKLVFVLQMCITVSFEIE